MHLQNDTITMINIYFFCSETNRTYREYKYKNLILSLLQRNGWNIRKFKGFRRSRPRHCALMLIICISTDIIKYIWLSVKHCVSIIKHMSSSILHVVSTGTSGNGFCFQTFNNWTEGRMKNGGWWEMNEDELCDDIYSEDMFRLGEMRRCWCLIR